jgi:hypothetical protein
MTRRTRTSREAENRLDDLEDRRARLDRVPALDHDIPEEDVERIIQASREHLDNPTDREVALAAVAARETTRSIPTTRRRP